ncbi:MAG: hypothetical protein A2315_06855 [Ignavibacteria bacterium RIFOXYB2_FULL_35_12]|nr:MAG: hypothetical protein A2058_08230 [Ignavibacteria bacterium GWA2_36_19]OGU51805.1 MAG: hypothetical protein A2006_07370 [Ignavibacteria bacterium GWC2_35_8]OGU62736.1 MAG: hypothetical protein A2X60_05020 [Ignavibacteria bacterium GWF2_35_20]OGU81566.1 MAG: hypothetical protein A2254_01280 [Ignavibacteria bacterium RIFOXYA2_FULL_35_9]OGU85707.1 MAG: hypothetical protein A3K31_05405 [Ignavibacteria bacterium RIFOXYA12_FULL_35_25]OGU89508.1 MAG: hypothetical protein A2492_10955 [Ignavibac
MSFSCKLNIRILALVSGIFLLSANILAQPDQRPHQPPTPPDSTRIVKMVNELSTALSLSKDQKEKITRLHFAHFQEAGELMKKDKAIHENNRAKMDALRKEFDEQVEALLNNDQKKKFEEFFKEHRHR